MGEQKIITEKSPEYFSQGDVKKFGWGVRHIQMLCMFVVMTSLFVVRGSMGVAVLAMTDHRRINDSNVEIFEWDKKTQGVVLSSFFWGYMTMQIPAGLLSKRFGGKPIILVAWIGNGVLCAALPVLSKLGGWQAVCALRVAMGLTQACLYPASHTLLGQWLPPQERTSLTGIVYGGSMVGTIISMPMSGFLAETTMGWKMIFYSVAVLMSVVAVIWYAFAASTPRQHRMMTVEEREYIEKDLDSGSKGVRSLKTPWGQIFRSVPVFAIIASHFGMCGAFILFFVDLPTYLERGLGISLKNSATLSALPYLGMWIGTFLSSILCEKVYNKGILSLVVCRKICNSISFYGTTIGLIVLSCLGPEQSVWAIVTLVITLFCKGASSAGFMVNHLDISPNFAGLLLSITNFLANINSVVTPILTGVILRTDPTDLSRWRIVFLTIAAMLFITNTVFICLATTDKQSWDSPTFGDRAPDPEELKPVMNAEKEREANQQTEANDKQAETKQTN